MLPTDKAVASWESSLSITSLSLLSLSHSSVFIDETATSNYISILVNELKIFMENIRVPFYKQVNPSQ